MGVAVPSEFHERNGGNKMPCREEKSFSHSLAGWIFLSYLCLRATIRGAGNEMKINDELLRQMESDLSLDKPFVKGKNLPIRNCWHFCTDGNAVDRLFDDDQDFRDGMNRVFIVRRDFSVIILAFCLMDTHVHFILYGAFEECNKFMHKFVQLTSRHIWFRHAERKKLWRLPISHQFIDNDFYLKVAICYVIKNAPVAGLPFNALDYPWSGNPLYFRRMGYWNSFLTPGARIGTTDGPDVMQGATPVLQRATDVVQGAMPVLQRATDVVHGATAVLQRAPEVVTAGTEAVLGRLAGTAIIGESLKEMSQRKVKALLKTKTEITEDVHVIDGIVHPGEYVAWEIVERIFKTHKSFNRFMCISKEEDVENRGGSISRLSIPIQEMRQYRNEICKELYGVESIRTLSAKERLKLAKVIRSRYNSSLKQIARVCGLLYEEVKDMI